MSERRDERGVGVCGGAGGVCAGAGARASAWWLSSLVVCGAIGVFVFYRVDGEAAGLALSAITLYLFKRGRAWWVTGLLMVWMMGTTVAAMVANIREFAGRGQRLLCSVGLILLALAAWLIVEAGLAVRAHRRAGHQVEGLEVELTEP